MIVEIKKRYPNVSNDDFFDIFNAGQASCDKTIKEMTEISQTLAMENFSLGMEIEDLKAENDRLRAALKEKDDEVNRLKGIIYAYYSFGDWDQFKKDNDIEYEY